MISIRIAHDIKARRISLHPMDDLVLALCLPGYDAHLRLDGEADEFLLTILCQFQAVTSFMT